MAAPTNEPPLPLVAIACQGGGSHAAFGAGVIHRLLEDDGQRFRLRALSGTSGGAVNAVLAWSGLIHGSARKGVAEAQRRLQGMWDDLGAASIPDMIRNWWGQFVLDLPFTWEVSPYVWDLGARDEMISLLRKWINLEQLPQDPERLNQPFLFAGATDILNGISVAIRGDGTVISRTKQALLVAEAGGHVARLDGSEYRPSDQRPGLLIAENRGIWNTVRSTLLKGRGE